MTILAIALCVVALSIMAMILLMGGGLVPEDEYDE